MPLKMTIELGDGTVEQLAVREQGPIRIGRDPSCHVVLPSPDVSRRHLTVEKTATGYYITDASANGTMVGDTLVRSGTIEAPGGLPLRVGPYVIRLEPVAPHAPPPAARFGRTMNEGPRAKSAPPPSPPRAAPPRRRRGRPRRPCPRWRSPPCRRRCRRRPPRCGRPRRRPAPIPGPSAARTT
ncbi:MAG: FHA domain-containing protein [Sandaracinaceae bacterium]|nr:FHA domain-containing protein [Sandaracinaceae bacterium]